MVEVESDSKTYCLAQPIGYTKQPGFDRRNLTGRDFGDPAKPIDEAVFQVQGGEPITLQAETILAIYGEHTQRCGPWFVRFVPRASAAYFMRFVKDGNSCRIELRDREGDVQAEHISLAMARRSEKPITACNPK